MGIAYKKVNHELFKNPVAFLEEKKPCGNWSYTPISAQAYTKEQNDMLEYLYGAIYKSNTVYRNKDGIFVVCIEGNEASHRRVDDDNAPEEYPSTEKQKTLKYLKAAFIENCAVFASTLPERLPIDGNAVPIETIKQIRGDFMTMTEQLVDINDTSAAVESEVPSDYPAAPQENPVGGTEALPGEIPQSPGEDTIATPLEEQESVTSVPSSKGGDDGVPA